jgi:ribosome maturation factor RimP
MGALSRIETQLRALAAEVAGPLGYSLEDLELLGTGRRRILRVTIDREGGVGVDDCAAFSRDFAALMDVEDPMRGAYTLEVSSPGLDRPLKETRHFTRSIGKLVRLVLREPMDGQGFLNGRLVAADDDAVRVAVAVAGKPDEEREVEVSRGNIKKARLEIVI